MSFLVWSNPCCSECLEETQIDDNDPSCYICVACKLLFRPDGIGDPSNGELLALVPGGAQ